MASLLSQLREMTTVVADTGDLDAIEAARPQDATTNPSLILQAASLPKYQGLVDQALREARERAGADADQAAVIAEAMDHVAVTLGSRILALVPGRVSTEVDARLSYDTEATVARARALIGRYAAQGHGPERVLIKIAATWEGIEAARVLEAEGIHCNLTLLFGLHQAIACAEAGVQLISPFVGRILDWYKASTGRDFAPTEDPGVHSVTEIYNYFKKFGHKTEVMGASFRNAGEIIELAGCDLLTIAPSLLQELEARDGVLVRKLDPTHAQSLELAPIPMDRAAFDTMHAANQMANEKLAEGIEKFAADAIKLEGVLAARLQQIG